jgi:hypothetical protein
MSYLTTERKHFAYTFTMNYPSDFRAQLVFNCGQSETDIYLDNISLRELPTSSVKDTLMITWKYQLMQNYPNPFNLSTMITYQLPKTDDVELSVYNLLGQKVATLVSGKIAAGQHQVEWNANGFAGGLYFYRLETRSFTQTAKMLLIK